MKTKTFNKRVARLGQFTLAVGMTFLWAGCYTAGYHKGDSAARSLQNAANDAQGESKILAETIGSLNDLVSNPASDLKPQFSRFNASLQHLVAWAERNDKTIRKITARNAEYFETWDKQLAAINYEVIRARSESRKAEVVSQFDKVNARYQEVQTTMEPLLNYLRDLRNALSADLTLDGLKSVQGIVENATANAEKVQSALVRLADNLNEAGNKMSSVAGRNTYQAPVAVKQ